MPCDKVRVKHKPVDKIEDTQLLDLVLQPTRTQPIRTCRLIVRNFLPADKLVVTKQHNEKSEELQPHSQADTENHGPKTRSRAFAERKCRCFTH